MSSEFAVPSSREDAQVLASKSWLSAESQLGNLIIDPDPSPNVNANPEPNPDISRRQAGRGRPGQRAPRNNAPRRRRLRVDLRFSRVGSRGETRAAGAAGPGARPAQPGLRQRPRRRRLLVGERRRSEHLGRRRQAGRCLDGARPRLDVTPGSGQDRTERSTANCEWGPLCSLLTAHGNLDPNLCRHPQPILLLG